MYITVVTYGSRGAQSETDIPVGLIAIISAWRLALKAVFLQ